MQIRKNYKNYINDNLIVGGGTSYSPVIKLISKNENLSKNTLIIFITDGDNDDKSKFEEEIRNISNKIALFNLLEQEMKDLLIQKNLIIQKIGKQIIQVLKNLRISINLSDNDLYLGLLSQYADWLKNKEH